MNYRVLDYGLPYGQPVTRNKKMDNQSSKLRIKINRILLLVRSRIIRQIFTRASAANLLMILFIVLVSIGTVMIWPPMGFIAAGVACGIYGFILGLE